MPIPRRLSRGILGKAKHSLSHRWNGLSNNLGYHAGMLAKQRENDNPVLWLLKKMHGQGSAWVCDSDRLPVVYSAAPVQGAWLISLSTQ